MGGWTWKKDAYTAPEWPDDDDGNIYHSWPLVWYRCVLNIVSQIESELGGLET